MKKLSLLALIVLVFSLAMAGGCSKKVSSTPAGTTAAGSGGGAAAAPGGLTAEQQRQAIDKIGAERIYFEFDKSDLSDASRQALTDKAELLKKYSALKVLIEGHCDDRGTNEYNMALGERRARAAYEFLILLGIDASRLSIISYGEEYPAVPGAT